MLEICVAFKKRPRTNLVSGFLTDSTSPISYQNHKIKLEIAPLQLSTRNDDGYAVFSVPVKNGFLNLGKRCYKSTNADINISIPIRINTNWLSAARTSSAKPHKDTIQTFFEEGAFDALCNKFTYGYTQGSTPSYKFLDEFDADKAIFRAFIEHYICDIYANFTNNNLKFEHLQHQFYAYNNALYDLNMLVKQAIEASGEKIAWMYPTTVAMAIQDESRIPPDISKSVISLSCMIEKNVNNSHAVVNVNAIPEGANSTLLISRNIFGDKMVKDQIISNIMKNPGEMTYTKDSVKNIYKYTSTNGSKLKEADYKGVYNAFFGKRDEEIKFGSLKKLQISVEQNLKFIINVEYNSPESFVLQLKIVDFESSMYDEILPYMKHVELMVGKHAVIWDFTTNKIPKFIALNSGMVDGGFRVGLDLIEL